MTGRLEGKVAVVCGGSQGLGLAIAGVFAGAGARLVLVARTAEKLRSAAADLGRRGAFVEVVPADVRHAEQAAGAIATAVERFGRLDVLVNCAGAFLWKRFTDVTAADWQTTIDTNLTAAFLLTQAAARRMIDQGEGGSIINIASIHGEVADANVVPQCAAKLGLVGLTRATAEALRPHAVRVNAISPGAIQPDSAGVLSEGLQGKITQEDVARAALYLASDDSRGITGATIAAYGATRPVVSGV